MIEYRSPDDLAEFWSATVAEAFAAPLEFERSFMPDYPSETHAVRSFRYRGIDGSDRFGWIARPLGVGDEPLPAFLWVPPYGRESKLPDAYGTRPGMVSMSVNLHGEGAYHQEKYRPERGYFAQGAESEETWIFRRFVGDLVVAIRILSELHGVDADRIGCAGMSQGGGLSTVMGAFCPLVRSVCADMPFFGDIPGILDATILRYPQRELKDFVDSMPLGRERFLAVAAYLDMGFVAAHCRVPTLVSLGEKDPACRPHSVRRIYDALPGEKTLITYPGGHDWDPGMIAANADWFARTM